MVYISKFREGDRQKIITLYKEGYSSGEIQRILPFRVAPISILRMLAREGIPIRSRHELRHPYKAIEERLTHAKHLWDSDCLLTETINEGMSD
jgi:hypothetical protein